MRGTKALGRAYEGRVGRYLRGLFGSGVHSGAWFEFIDANGPGCCQVDHYIVLEGQILLVECKLSETSRAWGQIGQLYRPVLEQYFALPVTGVQCARHLRSGQRPILDVRVALALPGVHAKLQAVGRAGSGIHSRP